MRKNMLKNIFLGIIAVAGTALFGGGKVYGETVGSPPVLENGVLTFQIGEYKLDFQEGSGWTIGWFRYRDIPIISFTGSNQTAIKFINDPTPEDDAFLGGGHGGEEIISLEVEVDGKSFPLENLNAPSGKSFVFKKHSRLDGYECLTYTRLGADGLEQRIEMRGEQVPENIQYVFIMMHCFTPQFLEYLGVIDEMTHVDGHLRGERERHIRSDLSGLGLFSESEGLAVVMKYKENYLGYEGNSNFINNWENRHNKHYFQVRPDSVLEQVYQNTIRVIETDTESWKKEVEAQIESPWDGQLGN